MAGEREGSIQGTEGSGSKVQKLNYKRLCDAILGQQYPQRLSLRCHEIHGATSHLAATLQATLAPISSHPASTSFNSSPAPTQAPDHPHSKHPWNQSSVASALRDAGTSPSHDLVPCVCLKGCHGANCCVYSCSPDEHCSVGISSDGSW